MTIGTDSQLLRVGSLTFIAVGQLLPHQLHSFHTQDYIYPIGFKVMRNYWSISGNVVDFTSFFFILFFKFSCDFTSFIPAISEMNKRCPYYCMIGDNNNKPEFKVSTTVMENGKEVEKTFVDSTARGVWAQILILIEKLRQDNNLVKVFPRHVTGEDLFGFNEPNVIKVLESLPGVESLTDYNFKYGRNPLIELPLAVNPSGCARSEPQMRTRVKRVHNFQRTTGAGKIISIYVKYSKF